MIRGTRIGFIVLDEQTHLWIKQALAAKGSSLGQVARSEGVSTSTVSIVSRGYRRSRRLELAIATAVDSTPQTLWPDRYIQEQEN